MPDINTADAVAVTCDNGLPSGHGTPASTNQAEKPHGNMPLFSFGAIADVQYADCDDGWNFAKTRIRRYRGGLVQLARAVDVWLQNESHRYFVVGSRCFTAPVQGLFFKSRVLFTYIYIFLR